LDDSPLPLGLGLDEDGSAIDDLVAFSLCAATSVDHGADGVLDVAIDFSLAAGSPTLATIGAGPQDILRSRVGASGSATLWRMGSSVGLVIGDAIDGTATDGTSVYFSLRPGSPTLLGPDGEADRNNDLIPNGCDDCLSLSNADQADADADAVGDQCDNWVMDANRNVRRSRI
jgi:hypothetical protein